MLVINGILRASPKIEIKWYDGHYQFNFFIKTDWTTVTDYNSAKAIGRQIWASSMMRI